jgi:hypothetical protein
VVKSLMQAQHKAMLKELKRSIFDERIDKSLGDHPDLTPRNPRDTIPDSPAASRLVSDPSTDLAAGTIAPEPPEDASVTAEMAVIGSEDWVSTPSEITSSEVSDVFRVIMQPAPDGQGADGAKRPPEIRIESLKPGAASSRRIQHDTVEIHSRPPTDESTDDLIDEPTGEPPSEPIDLEHHAVTAARPRRQPPPPPAPRAAGTPSPHVSARGSGNVLVSRPPIRVDNHSHPPGKRATPPPPPPARASRSMAPRTVREDPLDSLFDQQAISEKSLDEVILAYLSEDASKDEL